MWFCCNIFLQKLSCRESLLLGVRKTLGIVLYTIFQQRLLSLANFSIQRDLLCELQEKPNFLDDIIDKFAFLKDRRIDVVYKE